MKRKVDKIVRRELLIGRFQGTHEVSEHFEEGEPCVKAGIDSKTFSQILLSFNPEHEKERPGELEVIVRDVSRHENNHEVRAGFNGCPRNAELHAEKIISPIAEVLKPKGYNSTDIHYLANALEDTILHMDLNSMHNLDGIADFFDDVGRKSGYSDFYEAHVKINLWCWGNRQQKKKLGKYYKHDQKVREVMQNFITRTGMKSLDKAKVRSIMNDENKWPEIARVYAEEFSKLMQPGYARHIPDHSGKGTSGAEKSEETEGNKFDHEMESKEFKSRQIQKAHASGNGTPPWMETYEAMDLLYQSLEKKLEIIAKSYTHSESMRLFDYGTEPFDADKHRAVNLQFGFDDKGKVELQRKRWTEHTTVSVKDSPKGFPEARFCILDTSSSMGGAPNGGEIGRTNIIPWGDNSKYHYALLSFYGFLEYLKQNHLLKQTNIALANFSSDTIVKQGLSKAKRNALSPQWGGTHLDIDKVRSMFNGRDLLMFTVSDGDVENWDTIKDDFINSARKHHYFHLQIGGHSKMSSELKKAGFNVLKVSGNNDLANTVIDLTDKLYRK